MTQATPICPHRHQKVTNTAEGDRLQCCLDCSRVLAKLPYSPSSSDTRGTE